MNDWEGIAIVALVAMFILGILGIGTFAAIESVETRKAFDEFCLKNPDELRCQCRGFRQ